MTGLFQKSTGTIWKNPWKPPKKIGFCPGFPGNFRLLWVFSHFWKPPKRKNHQIPSKIETFLSGKPINQPPLMGPSSNPTRLSLGQTDPKLEAGLPRFGAPWISLDHSDPFLGATIKNHTFLFRVEVRCCFRWCFFFEKKTRCKSHV